MFLIPRVFTSKCLHLKHLKGASTCRFELKMISYQALTSSLKGNFAGFTGSQYDNTFNPGIGSKLGIRSKVTVDQAGTELNT